VSIDFKLLRAMQWQISTEKEMKRIRRKRTRTQEEGKSQSCRVEGEAGFWDRTGAMRSSISKRNEGKWQRFKFKTAEEWTSQLQQK